jgi:tRNA A-37 threonylcarbamoyl transferase component Bud32
MQSAQMTPVVPPIPAEICGYVVDSALAADQTYLAIGPGGRGIVLKKLDTDCLVRGLLHPSIRERLCRVRELAHAGVANLHGVGREGENAWLIWEFIEGQTCEQYLAAGDRKPRDLLVLARELILSVDSLHMQGIVHGAIGGGNVIIAPDNAVRLTHISPLLYTEMSVDVEAVVALLERAVQSRGERGSPLGQLLADTARQPMSLRLLGTKVAAMLETRDQRPEPTGEAAVRNVRRRALLAVAVIALLGLALGVVAWRAMDSGSDLHGVLRWIPGSAAGK